MPLAALPSKHYEIVLPLIIYEAWGRRCAVGTGIYISILTLNILREKVGWSPLVTCPATWSHSLLEWAGPDSFSFIHWSSVNWWSLTCQRGRLERESLLRRPYCTYRECCASETMGERKEGAFVALYFITIIM